MKTNIHLFVVSRSFHLRMRNFSEKSCRENQNTHFVFSNIPSPSPLPPENHTVYEMMWKNIVERDRPQMAIWRMHIA